MGACLVGLRWFTRLSDPGFRSKVNLSARDPFNRSGRAQMGSGRLSKRQSGKLTKFVLQFRALAMASFSPFSSRTPGMIAEPMTKDGVPAKLKASA